MDRDREQVGEGEECQGNWSDTRSQTVGPRKVIGNRYLVAIQILSID